MKLSTLVCLVAIGGIGLYLYHMMAKHPGQSII